MIKGKLVEAPWWPSGYESGLSLPWPEFNPWLGTEILQVTQCNTSPPTTKKKKEPALWRPTDKREFQTQYLCLCDPGEVMNSSLLIWDTGIMLLSPSDVLKRQ